MPAYKSIYLCSPTIIAQANIPHAINTLHANVYKNKYIIYTNYSCEKTLSTLATFDYEFVSTKR